MLHATYGSSTAGRTLACPGWVRLSSGIANSESSFAIDGTISHALLELKGLNNNFDFKSRLGSPLEGGIVGANHIAKAEKCWDLTLKLIEEYKILNYQVECRVTVPGTNDIFGTLDLIASSSDKGFLIDYKCGEGVLVEAVNNSQLLYSAMAGLMQSAGRDLLIPHRNFVGVIIQPNERGESLKVWEFTLAEVKDFEAKYLAKVAESREPGAKIEAGPHCKFCPAAPTCPAKNGAALRALRLNPEKLETLGESLALVSELKAWIRAVEISALSQMEAGARIENFKMVKKRANRNWINEASALASLTEALGDSAELLTPAKLKSPAEIEKFANSVNVVLDFESLTRRVSSGNTIAGVDDRRTAVISAAALASSLNSIK